MEPVLELPEADLDEIHGGQAEQAVCLTSVDGDCICNG